MVSYALRASHLVFSCGFRRDVYVTIVAGYTAAGGRLRSSRAAASDDSDRDVEPRARRVPIT